MEDYAGYLDGPGKAPSPMPRLSAFISWCIPWRLLRALGYSAVYFYGTRTVHPGDQWFTWHRDEDGGCRVFLGKDELNIVPLRLL